jgi:hypothetical protein
MAPPCKRYRKVYTWQVFSIRHIINIAEFATPIFPFAARPAILENRGGKSHFCDYFINRARYVSLSYYRKCRAYNSLHFLFFMFFCQINSFVVTACRNRDTTSKKNAPYCSTSVMVWKIIKSTKIKEYLDFYTL